MAKSDNERQRKIENQTENNNTDAQNVRRLLGNLQNEREQTPKKKIGKDGKIETEE